MKYKNKIRRKKNKKSRKKEGKKRSKYTKAKRTKRINKTKRIKKTKKTKKKRIRSGFSFLNNIGPEISLNVSWDSEDKGYNDLMSTKVKDYVDQIYNSDFNLIQSQENDSFQCLGQNEINLQAIQWDNWQKINWDDIECTEYNDWIKISPCDKGKDRAKIFVKYQSNESIGGFGIYLYNLHKNEITKEQHIDFVKALQETFGNKFIYIHNQDLDWFHAKEKI